MDLFRYLVRFLYKIRWYLVILPLIALVVSWFLTRNMERVYDANTTIYTGMITGYNLEGGTGAAGGQSQTNITNLMLIITTDNTIHEVALRLFGRCMMYGNPNKDNNYISAQHYRELSASVPADVKALINHKSESATYANLKAYEKPSIDNYLFSLLNYHPWFGINNITSKLKLPANTSSCALAKPAMSSSSSNVRCLVFIKFLLMPRTTSSATTYQNVSLTMKNRLSS